MTLCKNCNQPKEIWLDGICEECTLNGFTNTKTNDMKTGIELIAEERERQIKREGWSALHDSQHKRDELARAAACYALPHRFRNLLKNGRPKLWPWSRQWWKPGDYVVMEQTPLIADRIRELEKAGALIAAEIDRIQRRGGGN